MSYDPHNSDNAESSATNAVGTQALDELLVAYLDGELESGESRRVEELLSADPQARGALQQLDRTWNLLDKLEAAEVDDHFARTTLEMVAVAAAEDVRERQAELPRLRKWRFLRNVLAVFAVGVAGFLAVVAFRPDTNRQLLDDLPLLENVDEYHQTEDLEFLRRLQQEGVFEAKEGGEDA